MSRIYTMSFNEQSSSDESHVHTGNQYFSSLNKVKGKSQYGISYEVTDKKYDKNDMGYIFRRDYSAANIYYTHYKFNPFWKHFKYGYASAWLDRQGRFSVNNQLSSLEAGVNIFLLLHSNFSIYTSLGSSLMQGRDYYEPRIDGLFYKSPMFQWTSLNFTTNYNKRLAFDFGGRGTTGNSIDYIAYGYYVIPRYRISERWSVKLSYYYDKYNNEYGFANYSDDDSRRSVFGSRDVTTIVNTLTTRYLFKNDMSLSLIARHFWSEGKYKQFYNLRADGGLTERTWNTNEDFNSNYITADLVYNWQFAPGSFFLITYKNQIFKDNTETDFGYFRNLSGSIDDAQINSVSLKLLYYLDYQHIIRKKN